MATKYDEKTSCNACGIGLNQIKVISIDAGCVSECATTCMTCGFTDFWCYGFFESGAQMEGKSKKYSFDDSSND